MIKPNHIRILNITIYTGTVTLIKASIKIRLYVTNILYIQYATAFNMYNKLKSIQFYFGVMLTDQILTQ